MCARTQRNKNCQAKGKTVKLQFLAMQKSRTAQNDRSVSQLASLKAFRSAFGQFSNSIESMTAQNDRDRPSTQFLLAPQPASCVRVRGRSYCDMRALSELKKNF